MSVSIIIPSKNADNIDACVDSIRAAGEVCRVIVIDDGLSRRREDCEYIPGVKPFVWARNINLGIAAAGRDDVLILGDDTRLVARGMEFGQWAFWANETRSMVSAAITGAVGNPNQLPARVPEVWRLEPRMLCFVATMIPRRLLDQMGPLDERYVDYGCDDDDACWRAKTLGWRLAITDLIQFEHGVLPSEFRGHGARSFLPNLKRFMEKWGHDNWGVPNADSQFREMVGL